MENLTQCTHWVLDVQSHVSQPRADHLVLQAGVIACISRTFSLGKLPEGIVGAKGTS